MKWILVLFGILAVTHLVLGKPSKSKEPDYEEGLVNDEYDYEDEEDESEDGASVIPTIKSAPVSKTVRMGDTVYLPCDAIDADNYVTMWKKENELLYQDGIPLRNSESRYYRYKNRTLQIVNVNPNDTANYECSIVGLPEHDIKVVHNLQVLTPPKILQMYTAHDKNEVMIGSVLQLICNVTGNPKPKVIWSKEGNRVHEKHDYEGTSITINNFRKDNAGIYQCMADNGIGEPDTSALEIKAIHEPVITIEKMTVNSAIDYESQLTCIVHALPKATVQWKKAGEVLASNAHLVLGHEGNQHTLLIKKTQKSDFGNYSCFAQNKVGQAERHIVLSGKPAPARFVRDEPVEHDVRLTWLVESNLPIIEYLLEYRMKDTKPWKMVNPPINNPQGNVYTVEHVLQDLPVGIYETRLRSRNSYGWSPYSHHVVFEKNYSKDQPFPPASETREEPQGIVGGSGAVTICSTLLLVSVTLSSRFL